MTKDNGLPKGWTEANLSQCATRITDGTHLPPAFVDSGVSFLFVKHIIKGRLTFDDTKFISEQTWQDFQNRCPIEQGDVLYTAVGSYGVAVPVQTDRRFSFQRHIAHIKPHRQLDSRFLAYFLNSPFGLTQAHRVARGVAQKTVTLGDLKQFSINLAPFNEQVRVVAKIEELFSDLDAGVAALKRAKANLKRYRAAVLKAAVEGKLTEEWRAKHPAKEPASTLLARILKERRQKWEADQLAKCAAAKKEPPKNWREKYVEPSRPDISGLPELPEGWCWVALGQMAQFQNRRAFPSNEYTTKGVKLLRPGNLFPDGTVRWSEKNSRFMHPEWAETYPTYIVRGDELVMNLTAQSLADEFLGRVCLTRADESCLLNQRLARITPLGGLDNRFALYLLKSAVFRRFVNGLNTGSLIEHMFTSQLENCYLPLPPLAEQQEIVKEVERRHSIIEGNDLQIDSNLARASRLRQSILKQAFEGKLVSQDPEDEPASVLLERLHASRSAHEGNGKAATQNRTRGRRAKSKQLEGRADE